MLWRSTLRRISTVVLAGSVAIGLVGCIAEPYPVGRGDIGRDGRYEDRGQGSYGWPQPTYSYYCPSDRLYYRDAASCPSPWVPAPVAPEAPFR
jgi:hypothetical protein